MSKKPDEWTQLGESLQQELDGDAPLIAKQVFSGGMPGMTTKSDDEAADIIREAYGRGDRQFLRKLALQGPEQFLRVWKSLGGTVPPPTDEVS